MITQEEFVDGIICTKILNDKSIPPNERQLECIAFPQSPDLMIVAGPGSGKTTVLVLRALKHVILDRMLPGEIVITTFTKKAAAEIRSRLITWGIPLFDHFEILAKSRNDKETERHLALSDVNGFVTGTLDSLCERWLGRMRTSGETPPVMIENFASRQIYARKFFGSIYQDAKNKPAIDSYLSTYMWDGAQPSTQGEAVQTAKTLLDRIVQDRVNLQKYSSAKGRHLKARALIAKSLSEFHQFMLKGAQYDFALLEVEFLRRIGDPLLRAKLERPRALLIDEYQDTNPLQEEIYFKFSTSFGASVTIVGDDDQSLYRFRGATVELFRDFRGRFAKQSSRPQPEMRFLVENYRSTKHIVDFFNKFIVNDPNFKRARVNPAKPAIIASGDNKEKLIPVLGMFRDSASELADDLAKLLEDIFRNGGRTIPGVKTPLRGFPERGDYADAVFMGHSVNELGRAFWGNPPKPKLAGLLRESLNRRDISVFNPRGRSLRHIAEVRIVLGLISSCIDPDGELLQGLRTFNKVKDEIEDWIAEAESFIRTNPAPSSPHNLRKFVKAWQTGRPQSKGMKGEWPKEWPVLDLLYKLITWLPRFQRDPEFQVYLEAITRSVTQATAFSPYKGNIVRDSPHYNRSRESIFRDILSAIAQDEIEVDEDLLTHIPRNRINFMTIHQSKGLEFPLVVVDIGSDFTRNHQKQRFKRFPYEPSNVAKMEDDLAPFSRVGPLRIKRQALDRTFEDLIRLYYVAYSRPQTAMILVGHSSLLKYNSTTRNIATFWQQKGIWAWQVATPSSGSKRPPVRVSGIGITEI